MQRIILLFAFLLIFSQRGLGVITSTRERFYTEAGEEVNLYGRKLVWF